MRPITRLDWWLGIGLVVAAIVFHTLFPRYEIRVPADRPVMRIDRWTGSIGRPPSTAAAAVPTP